MGKNIIYICISVYGLQLKSAGGGGAAGDLVPDFVCNDVNVFMNIVKINHDYPCLPIPDYDF